MSHREDNRQGKLIEIPDKAMAEAGQSKETERCEKIDLNTDGAVSIRIGEPKLLYHVKYGEEKKEVVECLVNSLGGEDDEGEDVSNKTKHGNDGEKDTLHKKREGIEPGSWCMRKLYIRKLKICSHHSRTHLWRSCEVVHI